MIPWRGDSMRVRTVILTALFVAGVFGVRGADVVIDAARTFQTIDGWGHGGGVLGGTGGAEAMLPQELADPVNYQYLDFLTDDLGLTGTRTWEVGPRIDGTGSAMLALAIAPESPPQIDSVSLGNGINLSFLTLTNRHYAVEWLADLVNSHWSALTSGIPGNAATQTVTDATTGLPGRFYRLKVTTP